MYAGWYITARYQCQLSNIMMPIISLNQLKCREVALPLVNRYDNVPLLEQIDIISPQTHFLVSLVKAAKISTNDYVYFL